MAKKERKEKKEKPLDKMTATELRKYAMDTGEISGVHGMNKEELLAAIKEAKGIKDEGKHTEKVSMRDLKEKAAAMRGKKLEAIGAKEPQAKIDILRKKANRMKKRTRRAACDLRALPGKSTGGAPLATGARRIAPF
jgi:uncharacterized protein with von Willebrand factor type A (vWA) domain